MKKAVLLRLLNYWPPFFGAGVKITKISPEIRSIHVEMNSRFWNKNYVGTHFGGSLYSMVDPFLMLILMENLGPNYIVWDKAATIRFKKPGRGRVYAKFELTDSEIDSIRIKADSEKKVELHFQVQIFDESGDVVAEVDKVLSVRRKNS